ncbi:serine hydrolase domain-containing protein [Winogradskyella sp. A3E31]|uniref:serine hydrolase domain-containing protein n=1 Tax=Winogradskyella sp. A3E31 TaxID=3349637 RepID=UPI00398ABF5A
MKNTVIVLLIIFVSCKSPSDKKIEFNSLELEQLQTSIDSLFNSHIGENEPGAALLVAYDGEMIIGKGFGLRDLEEKKPITKNTNMRMGSVSKQFTALTVLKLVDEGKISLSDSVYSIFPVETFKDGTTIEQLINHTSGEADAEEAFFTEWDSTKIAENKNVLEWYSKGNRTITKPGEKYQYNNGIYELIPSIVEKVSEEEFAEFAKNNVFDKAGMKKTNFFNLAKPIEIEERAFCYEKDSLGNWTKVDGHFLNGLLGAGGVYTSVNDYFQYDLALRNKTILSEKTHDIIFKPSSTEINNGVESYYAMGWGVTDSTASHSGGWFGTNTFTKRYLDKPLTIAIFMNRNTLFTNDLVKKTDSLVVEYIKNYR